jgi:hypothetical protein
VKADVLDRLLGAVGTCAIVALGVDLTVDGKPVFGLIACLVGVGLLVELVVVAPSVAARARLVWTVPVAVLAAVFGVVVWVMDLTGSDYRTVTATLGTAGGVAFVLGMERWFRDAGWNEVADRYRRAATPLLTTAVVTVIAVGAALMTSEPLAPAADPGEGFFGRSTDSVPVWAVVPILLLTVLSWWRTSVANRFARRALQRAEMAVPGSHLVPVSQQPQHLLDPLK